jgi:hypothetical protein
MLHSVTTFEQQKRALCASDTKRYLLSDCVDTLAHGHHKIRSEQLYEEGTNEPTSTECTNIFMDENGDQHLVFEHDAAKESPMLQHLMEDDNENGDVPEQEPPKSRRNGSNQHSRTMYQQNVHDRSGIR